MTFPLPPPPRPSASPGPVPLLLLGLACLSVVGARVMTPSQPASGPTPTVVLPVAGADGRPELLDEVLRYAPSEPTSVVNAAHWIEDGLEVTVRTTGPRLVVLLDRDGAASVARVERTGRVVLPTPSAASQPPFLLTVLSIRGTGMVVDAAPVQLAAAR